MTRTNPGPQLEPCALLFGKMSKYKGKYGGRGNSFCHEGLVQWVFFELSTEVKKGQGRRLQAEEGGLWQMMSAKGL